MYQDAFNHIAPSWYNLRHHSIMLPELQALAQKWGNGRLLNIGCAHGADFIPFKEHFKMTGVDIAWQMETYLQKYSTKFGFTAEFKCADMVCLPFDDQSFDWLISIACLHHLETATDRLKALQEMKRVLQKGGEAFISVWNKGQERFADGSKEQIIPYTTTTTDHKKNRKVLRYHYLYEYDELASLAKEAGFQVISILPETSHIGPAATSRNICLLLKKED